jgi:signal transduction histidine kinase
MNPIDLFGKVIEISHSNLEMSSRIRSILNIISQDLHFEEVLAYTQDQDKRLTCRFMNDKSALFPVLSKYRCHVGEGIAGGVAQKRSPQFFTSKDVPPRFGCLFYPQLDEMILRFKTFAFLPLSDDSYLYGVLIAISMKESIHDAEKVLLSMLSREIGGILRSYSLIIESKKRISELATLSELGKVLTSDVEPQELLRSIALTIAKALNAQFVTIKLEYPSLPIGLQRFTYGTIEPSVMRYVNELEGEAIKNKRPASLKEGPSEAERGPLKLSVYTAPMLSKNRVIGTITMGAAKVQYFVVEENSGSLINTISNYMSNGLENTLLNRRLRDVVRELGDAQKRLIEQEKLKSLGEMTANIAHEIKNPLVIIGGFTKRLAKKMQLTRSENRYVEIIMKEVVRLESILNEVLNYVKEGPIITGSCDINSCIEETLSLFLPDNAWKDINVERSYDHRVPAVNCDSQQIKQVFINILMNAFEAMGGKGKIDIRTEEATVEGKKYLAAAFSDTGGGIDPSIMDNIFNPFFTTKERGTGLGLAISNKIVINHNGRLEIRNTVGKGATFIVYFPLKNNTPGEEVL